jgi:diguanylate cyclase (GGDEF)-like protein
MEDSGWFPAAFRAILKPLEVKMRNSLRKSDIKDLLVLQNVAPETAAVVLGNCNVLDIDKGQVLLRAGQVNQNLYLILSGQLTVFLDYPKGVPVAILERGETVGELSVIDDSPATAYVVAEEKCRVLEVDENSFWRLTSLSHAFACNMLLLLSDRLRSSDETIVTNIRLRKRFQRDAMVDALTGLHNRRWLDLQLPRLINRHARSGIPLSILLFDVDNFKVFNDRHGHNAGDDVLALVARTTMLSLRPTDLSARYGGEEFVVVLAGIGSDLAWIAAERLRRAMELEQVVAEDETVLPAVTISLGIAEAREGDNAESLLKRADAAMYRAKKTGRNRTCVEAEDS